jgi:cysteinyl-tRNA synthetase
MARLEAMLPPTTTVLGIDEHTAISLDFADMVAQVTGQGGVTVRYAGNERHFENGDAFDLDVLGAVRLPSLDEGLPNEVVQAVLAVEHPKEQTLAPEVSALLEEREAARRARDWARADAVRDELARRGYVIDDTPEGPRLRQATPA